MVHEAFNKAFHGLVGAFTRYHDTARSPESISALGAARVDLEEARAHARVAREAFQASSRRTPTYPSHTGVGDDDVARLRVLGTGLVQG